MLEFSVRKYIEKKDITREEALGKVAAHSCLTLILKDLKISVEHGREVPTNTKHNQTLYTILTVV
jgi:hypothetical protein